MEECFKLIPSDWNRAIYVLFLLILLPTKVDIVPKKRRDKENVIRVFSSNNGKVIFILLAKVLIFYVRFISIYVWKLGFYGLVLRFFGVNWSSSFQNCFKNLL